MLFVFRSTLLLFCLAFLSCSSDEKVVEVNPNNDIAGGDDKNPVPEVTVFKKVLIEDYVATWCGNCILAIEKSDNADPKVFVPVAIHFLGSSLENSKAIQVAQINSVSSQTTVIVDKHTTHNFRNGFDASNYSSKSLLAIAMDSEINGNNLSFDLKFKFYKDFSDLRYSVYLTENNIIASQRNYQFTGSAYKNSPSTITNFNHNHVLKDVILNQSINNSQASNKNVLTKSHSFSLQGLNSKNAELIVFVESSSEVLNTQNVKAGENIDFHAENK